MKIISKRRKDEINFRRKKFMNSSHFCNGFIIIHPIMTIKILKNLRSNFSWIEILLKRKKLIEFLDNDFKIWLEIGMFSLLLCLLRHHLTILIIKILRVFQEVFLVFGFIFRKKTRGLMSGLIHVIIFFVFRDIVEILWVHFLINYYSFFLINLIYINLLI